MSRSGLDDTTEEYQLCVDNLEQENSQDDNLPSCAGNFEILLQPHLDLSPLLYLKAVEAEISLAQISIGSVPISFSRTEYIRVFLELDSDVAYANKTINKILLTRDNETSLDLPLTDHICRTPEDVVDFMNDTFRYKLTYHMVYQYLRLFFDDDVLEKESLSTLSKQDIKLLLRYIDIALYTRNKLHEILTQHIGVKDDISTKISYSGKNTDKLTAAQENKIITESECLLPKDKRRQTKQSKSVNFDLFGSIDLSVENQSRRGVDVVISTDIAQWLQDNKIDPTALSAEDKEELQKVVLSNKSLIELGLLTRKIIFTEKERIDNQTKSHRTLFHHDFLSFDLDISRQKVVFHLQPKQFLAEKTSVTVYLPRKCSYTLGADISQDIVIGPIDQTMRFASFPRLTNRIMSPNQQLPLNIRHKAQICHLTSDIVTGKGIDQFLQHSPYDDHFIIYSHNIDENVVTSGCVTATDPPQRFLKIKQAHRILEKIEFKILDENFQICMFSRKTYTRLAFCIRPVSI